ncbi:MAG: polyamine ABC transporter ATP-binding protein [Alistipes sp.]|nr:polyamine ABC transporter ATP-binding protein [Alistipes sp.]MBQ5854801.1 polyamine ABC transporter ATP-binding protein [Alistipes sp.]
MDNKTNTIIKIEHLSKSFGDKVVLNDINLDIRRGEFITLLGPSGCGKTTLLRMIAGFLKPDSGAIVMDGNNITEVPPHLRPLNTVFQRYALFPHLNVYENIAFGLKLNKVPAQEIETRIRKALRMVSMTDYEDRDVNSLSGGQQQRVAIARAIVNRPKVLLLDEPLAALDLKMRKDMQMELKQMHQELGITFIYVTHDQEEALTLSDTVVVMSDGKIQQIGTPIDIYNEPINSFVADFIGESNILNGTMAHDLEVEFIGHTFECVDKGFGSNAPVDVVVRPEDIYIIANAENAKFTGTVKSCIFKGVHYEMFVETDKGYELMIQDYNAFEVGSTVGMFIKPSDIHVMQKERICNTFEGRMTSPTTVEILGAEFECADCGLKEGDNIYASVNFNRVELQDNKEDGTVMGEVEFILYKGNHYHLTVLTDDGEKVYVDTNDIWDKGDLVGISISASDLHITKRV